MSAFSTASKTRMWEPYIRWKGRVPFYWCHNPYWRTCHQILFMSISLALCDDCSTLLSFLWSSYDTWWLLYRCRVCFYVHSRHPNSLLLPGMYDCQMDWTEVHQSRPKQDKYTGTCKQIDKTVYRNSLYIFIILFVHLFSWIFIFFSFIAFQSMGASSTRNQSFFFFFFCKNMKYWKIFETFWVKLPDKHQLPQLALQHTSSVTWFALPLRCYTLCCLLFGPGPFGAQWQQFLSHIQRTTITRFRYKYKKQTNKQTTMSLR